jgi:hypothetical protein
MDFTPLGDSRHKRPDGYRLADSLTAKKLPCGSNVTFITTQTT